MVQSAIAVADPEPVAPAAPAAVTEVCDDLLKLFGSVSDGRSGQGRDHPVAVVLALTAAAVVAGMKGYAAIAGWVKDVPPPVLADQYLWAGASAADLARHVRGQWAIESLHWPATPFTKKINPRSEPDPGLGSWPRYATWQSAPCAYSDEPISPKLPDGPDDPWTVHLPSSASLHDLETAAPVRARRPTG